MDHTSSQELRDLAEWLKAAVFDTRAVIGFDGFVDEVVHVVDKRLDPESYTRVPTLTEYGRRIAATSGLSSNVEIVTLSKKLGGNGPILANALLTLGARMTYIGALGYPDAHPVFHDMIKRCESVYSVSNPSSTDAMEFEDGKIIRTKLSPFLELTFEAIKERVGLGVLAGLIDDCSLIGFENWSLTPYSRRIWQGIYDEVLPLLKTGMKDKILFFDLADPASRTAEDLKRALKTISLFSGKFNVILGLNLREAVQVANTLGGDFGYSDYDLEKLAEHIKCKVNVGTLVIHPLKEACCIADESFSLRTGPYCAKPVLTTGAGDNFNAGFLMGRCLGADASSSLLLGMAASGFYVRNSRSASIEEITGFLKSWANGEIE